MLGKERSEETVRRNGKENQIEQRGNFFHRNVSQPNNHRTKRGVTV